MEVKKQGRDDHIKQSSIQPPTETFFHNNIILGIRMRIFASRKCADYVRASYAGAGEALVARVTFAVGEAVWCL